MENETSESIDENEEDGKVITVPDVNDIPVPASISSFARGGCAALFRGEI